MNQRSIPCAFPACAERPGDSRGFGSTRMIFFLLLFFFTGLSLASFGQLKLQPVQRKYPSAGASGNPAGRTKADALNLPFWDDFSFTPVDDPDDTTANYPLDSIWVNSKSTWISSAIGINAPSINVASMDGLDSLGLAYSNEVLANGFRDQLVSRPIKLAAADPGSTFFSFFYQWQGNGEPPDKNDFLRVEFLDATAVWQHVMTIYPKSSFQRTEFYDTIVQVSGAQFFHNAFQFRFRTFGRQSGPFDTWNVDYIYLNDGRDINDISFPDRTLASTLTSLLGDYNAVPIQHFFTGRPLDSISFDVKNLKTYEDILISVGFEVHATFNNYTNNSLSTSSTVLQPLKAVGNEGGLVHPLQRITVTASEIPDPDDVSQFDPDADSISIVLKGVVVSDDMNETTAPDYLPIDFRTNDTLSTTYHLNNYYAYDDGSAEYSAVLSQAGNKVVCAFDMATDQADTLAGIDIYVPPFGVSGSVTADFLVFADSAGVPERTPIYTIFSKSVQRRGINEFQRIAIALSEAVRVSGRFYIGWKAPVSGVLPVGVDYSNNTSDKIFEYIDGKWMPSDAVQGSLMIRPLFGDGVGGPVTGIPKEPWEVSIYPNPAKGEFILQGRAEILSIVNVTGQPVSFQTTDIEDEKKKVSMKDAAPGLYLLKLKRGNALRTQKIVVY
jgi:hypothetical protein